MVTSFHEGGVQIMGSCECGGISNACRACKEKCLVSHSETSLSYPNGLYSFYKIMSADSLLHLEIPNDIANWMQYKACRLVSLEGPSGHLWHVTLRSHNSSLCFKDGWRNFISDHSIEAEDILVFRHVLNTHFLVQIFGPLGYEKQSFFNLQSCTTCCSKEGSLPKTCSQKICEHREISTKEVTSLENPFVVVEQKSNKHSREKYLAADTKEFLISCDTEIEHMPTKTNFTKEQGVHDFKWNYSETYCPNAGTLSDDEYIPNHSSKIHGYHTPKISRSNFFIYQMHVGLSKEKLINKDVKVEFDAESLSADKLGSAIGEACVPLAYEVKERLPHNGKIVAHKKKETVSPLPATIGGINFAHVKHATVSPLPPTIRKAVMSSGMEKKEFSLALTRSAVSAQFRLNIPKVLVQHWFPKKHTVVVVSNFINPCKWYTITYRGNLTHFNGFCGNWRSFACANKLEEGDICIFKLASREFYIFEIHVVKQVKKEIYSQDGKNAARTNPIKVYGKRYDYKLISQSHAQQYPAKYMKHVSKCDLAWTGTSYKFNSVEENSIKNERAGIERAKDLYMGATDSACIPIWEQKLNADILKHRMKQANKTWYTTVHAKSGSFSTKAPRWKNHGMQRTEKIDRKRKRMSENIKTPLGYQGTSMRGAIKDPILTSNVDRYPQISRTRDGILKSGQSYTTHGKTGIEVIQLD